MGFLNIKTLWEIPASSLLVLMRGQPLGAFDLVKYCHQVQAITLVQTVVNPLVLSRLGVVPLALFGVS